jgi:hypothetical protein
LTSFKIPEPAVSRQTLVLTAAVVWSAVGVGLAVRAALWFAASGRGWVWLAPLALVVGLLKGRFLLIRLAARNVERLRLLSPHKERICLFAFQSVQSFLIVLGMIGLGIVLRHTSLSREALATVYLAVGTALFLASFRYWRAFTSAKRDHGPRPGARV